MLVCFKASGTIFKLKDISMKQHYKLS